jgi:hypothetical protein
MGVLVGVLLTSPEDRFRIRGLLYTTATENADAADNDDNFFVASVNDTHSDQQVHSEWHARRAPECCKRVARVIRLLSTRRRNSAIQLG